MRIPHEEQERLRSERGIAANEACDNCGAILSAFRYTRRGEPGAWCSETCRDGEAAVAERERRRAGRRSTKTQPQSSEPIGFVSDRYEIAL